VTLPKTNDWNKSPSIGYTRCCELVAQPREKTIRRVVAGWGRELFTLTGYSLRHLFTTRWYINKNTYKQMQLTKLYAIKLTEMQKKTLQILKTKYRINASQFIRDAINEKLEREKKNIIEVHKYLNEVRECPF
jgi:hypothetical protein